MNFQFPRLDIAVIVALTLSIGALLALGYWMFGSSTISVSNPRTNTPALASSVSGRLCDEPRRRPLAVMLASDAEARPLSGIGQADVVFEMPVTPNGITRMMAVYQCTQPSKLGSIRSARGDFIPLAQGLDAILVHWGGEKDALTALNGGVIDNIDALKYEGSTFYRDAKIARPHNGFTSSDLLWKRAQQLAYRASTSREFFVHQSSKADRNIGSLADTITVAWPQGMDVAFSYDSATGTYLRSRGGSPEIDAATGQRVSASVVVKLTTEATFLHDQYIHVATLGHGIATIWQRGQRINALWKKERATDPLLLTDSTGNQIPLEPGTIWVLIDAPLPTP